MATHDSCEVTLLFRGNCGTTEAKKGFKKGAGVRMGRRGKKVVCPKKLSVRGKCS